MTIKRKLLLLFFAVCIYQNFYHISYAADNDAELNGFIEKLSDKELEEFYTEFTRYFCVPGYFEKFSGTMDIDKIRIPFFSGPFLAELRKQFPDEMYYYYKSHMSMSPESSFIFYGLKIADQTGPLRYNLKEKPFNELDSEEKYKMKKVYFAYRKIAEEYKYIRKKKNKDEYYLYKLYYNPYDYSRIKITDMNENGICYYPDGWINPVINNQTHPEKGVYIGTNDYNNLKTLISSGKFQEIANKYVHKSISQNKAIINTNTTKMTSKVK